MVEISAAINTLRQIEADSGAERIAVCSSNLETGNTIDYRTDEWFHAASTIKVAVLLIAIKSVVQGKFRLDSRVHVRNRFLSIADGSEYRIDPARDANEYVHRRIGKLMSVENLCREMIV